MCFASAYICEYIYMLYIYIHVCYIYIHAYEHTVYRPKTYLYFMLVMQRKPCPLEIYSRSPPLSGAQQWPTAPALLGSSSSLAWTCAKIRFCWTDCNPTPEPSKPSALGAARFFCRHSIVSSPRLQLSSWDEKISAANGRFIPEFTSIIWFRLLLARDWRQCLINPVLPNC